MESPTEAEEWRPVVGFEGLYEVSNKGRVKRIGKAAANGKGRGGGARRGRILKPQPRSRADNPYVLVSLWRSGQQYGRLVHVLVAAAFIGPCPAGMEVNHKNGKQKSNNCVGNLEYMTRSENMKHAYATGLSKPPTPWKMKGHLLAQAKRLHGEGLSLRAIGRKLGVSHRTVGHNLRRTANVGSNE